MDGWNSSFLLGWPIFGCYVSFGEGISFSKKSLPSFQRGVLEDVWVGREEGGLSACLWRTCHCIGGEQNQKMLVFDNEHEILLKDFEGETWDPWRRPPLIESMKSSSWTAVQQLAAFPCHDESRCRDSLNKPWFLRRICAKNDEPRQTPQIVKDFTNLTIFFFKWFKDLYLSSLKVTWLLKLGLFT